MISCELAKQLKDAGFPQTHVFIERGHAVPHICVCGAMDLEDVHIPVLSELIKACGEGIYSLRRTYEKDKWVAHGYDIPNTDIQEIHLQALGQKGFIGSTPEEAVARLWLALQEPKKVVE